MHPIAKREMQQRGFVHQRFSVRTIPLVVVVCSGNVFKTRLAQRVALERPRTYGITWQQYMATIHVNNNMMMMT